MSNLFLEFALKCMKAKVTPAEREIVSFLACADRLDLQEDWIKKCFYSWKQITNEIRISNSKYI